MWGVLTLEDVKVSPASLDLVIFPLFPCSVWEEQSSFLTNRSVDLLYVGFLLSQVGALFYRNFVAGWWAWDFITWAFLSSCFWAHLHNYNYNRSPLCGPCLFSSHRLQLQQKTITTDFRYNRIRVLLPPKTHGFSPWMDFVCYFRKKHMVFSFSAGTLVLPRLPKIVC